jgi:hypothetical protein
LYETIFWIYVLCILALLSAHLLDLGLAPPSLAAAPDSETGMSIGDLLEA